MRIDGTKHRLLADLEHKPWAAEDGEEWVASFSAVPETADANEIELTVAPDIAIPLTRSESRTQGTKAKSSQTSARPASRRKPRTDRGEGALDQERAKARDLRRELEHAATDRGRLAGERDALIAERDSMRREQARARAQVGELQHQLSEASAPAGLAEAERDRLARELLDALGERDRLAAERDVVMAERDSARREHVLARDALLAERDAIRREHAHARERVAELQDQLKATEARARASVAEAKNRLKTERAETKRVRTVLVAHEAVVAERDRLAAELETARAEQERLAVHVSQPRSVHPDTARVARRLTARSAIRGDAARRSDADWTTRAKVLVPLFLVLFMFAHVLHFV
jgi:chromosome segregation ATPase